MTDPLSIVLISAAVGGVAGKFTEKAWDSGEKWLSNYYRDHAPLAKFKAEQNSLDFLAQLAQRVKQVESQNEENKKRIEESLNQPDYSVLVQKAIISSAQTDDKQKHELLSRLVSDRLTQDSESLFALSSQLACEAISKLNARQMALLGILATIKIIRPIPFPPPKIPKDILSPWWANWLNVNLRSWQNLSPKLMDYLHLEALSCIKYDPYLVSDIKSILDFPKKSEIVFDYNLFSDLEIGKQIINMWEKGLTHAYPTTIGILVGIYVHDSMVKTYTAIDGWENIE